jgi:dihydrofolate reductase
MRKVVASEFTSLDGVVDSPQRWQLPYFDEEMGREIQAVMEEADTMLLGRVPYEEWAAFFPSQSTEDVPSADYMNEIPKFVVSRTFEGPREWNNSTLLEGSLVKGLGELKRHPGKDISISGSSTLVRSLLAEDLLDELNLMVHPGVVGGGKRLFEEWGDSKRLELVDSKTFKTGVVSLTYRQTASIDRGSWGHLRPSIHPSA